MNPNMPIDKQNQAEDTMGPEDDMELLEPEEEEDYEI